MKTSAIVAKSVSRLFILLLIFAIIVLLRVDSGKLHQIYFTGRSKWTFLFPGILVAGFVTLFVYSTVTKYRHIDWNWVLVLNTVILMAYCVTIFFRIFELISH